MLRIWGRTNSVNVQKVLWAAAELGLAFKLIGASGAFGIVDTPKFRAMNPNGLVPVIDDNGFVLWESNTITRYLAASHGNGALYANEPRGRALAERWMDWQATALWPAMHPVFHGLIRHAPDQRDPAAIAAGIERTEKKLDLLDGQLEASPFAVGESFGVADIALGVTVSRWSKLPIERRPHPHVERWLESLRQRPAFQAHVDLPLS